LETVHVANSFSDNASLNPITLIEKERLDISMKTRHVAKPNSFSVKNWTV
jgi:hypothetical protein